MTPTRSSASSFASEPLQRLESERGTPAPQHLAKQIERLPASTQNLMVEVMLLLRAWERANPPCSCGECGCAGECDSSGVVNES